MFGRYPSDMSSDDASDIGFECGRTWDEIRARALQSNARALSGMKAHHPSFGPASKGRAQRSLPELLLSGEGTADSYALFREELEALSDAELEALEDDLEFYAETKLVGVQMSRLLSVLGRAEPARRHEKPRLTCVA